MPTAVVCELCHRGLIVNAPVGVGFKQHCSWCGAEYGHDVPALPFSPPKEQVREGEISTGGTTTPELESGNENDRLGVYKALQRKCRKGHKIPLGQRRCPRCNADKQARYRERNAAKAAERRANG